MSPKSIHVLLALLFVSLCSGRGRAETEATEADVRSCQSSIREVAKLNRTSTFKDAQQEVDKADCERADVYCVDVTGYPVPSEEPDPGLKSGQSFTVKLFGPDTCNGVLSVGTNIKQSDVSLFRKSLQEGGKEAGKQAIKLLSKSTVKLPLTAESVTVVVSRQDKSLSIHGAVLPVTPPRYYLDVGLLVPFTVNYQRVSTSRVPGSTEVFIREEHTIRPAGAVALTYFPAGQYAVPRFTDYHGLGIQVGVGADFDRLDDEFYMGGLWEPIPGAGISAGLALISMQKLQPGYPEGALVKPNDVPKDEFLGPRFYFGISLNTEAFQTALKLGEKALVPN